MKKRLSGKLITQTKEQKLEYQQAIDKLQLVVSNLDYSLMIKM